MKSNSKHNQQAFKDGEISKVHNASAEKPIKQEQRPPNTRGIVSIKNDYTPIIIKNKNYYQVDLPVNIDCLQTGPKNETIRGFDSEESFEIPTIVPQDMKYYKLDVFSNDDFKNNSHIRKFLNKEVAEKEKLQITKRGPKVKKDLEPLWKLKVNHWEDKPSNGDESNLSGRQTIKYLSNKNLNTGGDRIDYLNLNPSKKFDDELSAPVKKIRRRTLFNKSKIIKSSPSKNDLDDTKGKCYKYEDAYLTKTPDNDIFPFCKPKTSAIHFHVIKRKDNLDMLSKLSIFPANKNGLSENDHLNERIAKEFESKSTLFKRNGSKNFLDKHLDEITSLSLKCFSQFEAENSSFFDNFKGVQKSDADDDSLLHVQKKIPVNDRVFATDKKSLQEKWFQSLPKYTPDKEPEPLKANVKLASKAASLSASKINSQPLSANNEVERKKSKTSSKKSLFKCGDRLSLFSNTITGTSASKI